MVGGFCGVVVFLFAHETFWDRKAWGREKNADAGLGEEELKAKDDRVLHCEIAGSLATINPPKTTNESTPSSSLTLNIPDPSPPPSASKPTPSSHLETGTPTTTTPSSTLTYTSHRLALPALPFKSNLRPFHGRLLPPSRAHWHHLAARPLLLFMYPSILYSAAVYACSLGWLVVISESVAVIYRSRSSYHLSALSTGLVYLGPFIGGVLGSAVAGKVSDLVVRGMARRNKGVYEPEFRLVMMVPVTVCMVGGLIGFGWSAGVGDVWIVPTVWFGVVAFGCAL